MRKIVAQAVQAADSLGVPVYLVGGPVRDLLLHRPCRDLDLAVEGNALALARRLAADSGARVVAEPRFGTATVCWPDGASLDLASTRSEIYAAPATLPQVTPADIRTDLGRRDFSINALALSLNGASRGECLDLCRGCEDLRHKRVRILHARSFSDDPTRLFRAVRFEQRLGFGMEANTRREFSRALAQGRLGQLSATRMFQELRLVMQEPDYAACLKRLARRGVLSRVHPGLKPLSEPLASGLGKVLAGSRKWDLEAADEDLLKFLALTRALTPAGLKSFLKRFPCPRTWARAMTWQQHQSAKLIRSLAGCVRFSPAQWVARLEPCPRENLIFLLVLHPHAVWARGMQTYLRRWARVKPVLTGEDLQALGYASGPGFGKMLAALRHARLEGELSTRAEEEKYLRENYPRRGL
jgi:tRNA nucleotidyltransferase (CCA-adding enzyme)